MGVLRELAAAYPMLACVVVAIALMIACHAARTAWHCFEEEAVGGAISSAAIAVGIAVWLALALAGGPRTALPGAGPYVPLCAAARC